MGTSGFVDTTQGAFLTSSRALELAHWKKKKDDERKRMADVKEATVAERAVT